MRREKKNWSGRVQGLEIDYSWVKAVDDYDGCTVVRYERAQSNRQPYIVLGY